MPNSKKWSAYWGGSEVEVKSTQVKHKGHFDLAAHTLRYKKFSGEWSAWLEREQVRISPSVAVILYDPKKDMVVMVEQFRLGLLSAPEISPWMLEVVAGFVDSNEKFEDAVIREAQEEANVFIKKLLPIYQFYPSPGGLTEKIATYCGIVDASDVSGIHGNAEEDEDIKVHTLKFLDLEGLVEGGMLTSSSTLICFLWLLRNRTQLRALDYL